MTKVATTQVTYFNLLDATGETDDLLKGSVEINEDGVYISVDGYATPFDGITIVLDNVRGVPTLRVWSDFNQGDPTHEIELTEAKEPA